MADRISVSRTADNDPDFYHADRLRQRRHRMKAGRRRKVWAVRGERGKIADNPIAGHRW